MSWICPNCSSCNGDETDECFVCGMLRPKASTEEVGSGEGDIYFSDVDSFYATIMRLLKSGSSASRSSKTKRSKKERAAEDATMGHMRAVEMDSLDKGKCDHGSDFAEPWPEHSIRFDAPTIKDRGYVRSERSCIGDVKGYVFYQRDGSSKFIRLETLMLLKMANKI